jgi:deazaflavin-dependent oxidoreductase (nitroreductase family)
MTDLGFPDARWGSENSRLRKPLTTFAATKPGAWFLKTMTPIDRAVLTRSKGRFTILGPIAAPILLLTTTGAKSGIERTSPLLFARDGARLIVTGSNFGQPHHPAWTGNLLKNPLATVAIGGHRTAASAHCSRATRPSPPTRR